MSVLYQTHQLLQTFNYSQFNSQVSWILKMVIVAPWGVQYSVNQWNPMGLVRDFLMHTMDLIKCVCVSLSLSIYIYKSNQTKSNLYFEGKLNSFIFKYSEILVLCDLLVPSYSARVLTNPKRLREDKVRIDRPPSQR